MGFIPYMTDRIIEHALLTITFKKEGIIHLDYKDGDLTLEKSKEIFALTRKYAPWEAAPLFITGSDFLNDSKESKEYNGSEEVLKHCTAIAFLSDNTAKKLLANFFIYFFGGSVPMRSFSTAEEALVWLKKYPAIAKENSIANSDTN